MKKKKTILGVGDRKFQLDSYDIYVLLSSVIKRVLAILDFHTTEHVVVCSYHIPAEQILRIGLLPDDTQHL